MQYADPTTGATVSVEAKYKAMQCDDFSVSACPVVCPAEGTHDNHRHMGKCEQNPRDAAMNELQA